MNITADQRITTNQGEDPKAFFASIQQALARHGEPITAPATPVPEVDETLARLARASDDLPALFTQRAQAIGMRVHQVAGVDKLSDALGRVLRDLGATWAVAGFGEAGKAVKLGEAIEAQRSLEVVDWRTCNGLDVQFDADVGITDVHAALAETGTLVCCGDAAHSRGLSLVPEHHVAVVRESDILPDMLDYWQRLKGVTGKDLPSSIVFITGPSKTSDIEGVLVTGVHGPRTVDVLLVDE